MKTAQGAKVVKCPGDDDNLSVADVPASCSRQRSPSLDPRANDLPTNRTTNGPSTITDVTSIYGPFTNTTPTDKTPTTNETSTSKNSRNGKGN